MKMFVFEGTQKEIREVAQSMLPMASDDTVSVKIPEERRSTSLREQSSEQPKKFVSEEFAHRVLTRRPPLSAPVKAVFKALNHAYPGWVPLTDLHVAADYTPQQFAGLMGAFGRRMSHTDDYDADAHFFDYRWNDEREAWGYALPDSVYQVYQVLNADEGD